MKKLIVKILILNIFVVFTGCSQTKTTVTKNSRNFFSNNSIVMIIDLDQNDTNIKPYKIITSEVFKQYKAVKMVDTNKKFNTTRYTFEKEPDCHRQLRDVKYIEKAITNNTAMDRASLFGMIQGHNEACKVLRCKQVSTIKELYNLELQRYKECKRTYKLGLLAITHHNNLIGLYNIDQKKSKVEQEIFYTIAYNNKMYFILLGRTSSNLLNLHKKQVDNLTLITLEKKLSKVNIPKIVEPINIANIRYN